MDPLCRWESNPIANPTASGGRPGVSWGSMTPFSQGHGRGRLGTEVDKEPLYSHLLVFLEKPGGQSQSLQGDSDRRYPGEGRNLNGNRRRRRDSQCERLEKAGPPCFCSLAYSGLHSGDTCEDAVRGPELFEDPISPLVHGESY